MDTSKLGMGVMLQMLSGYGDSLAVYEESVNKHIAEVTMDGDALRFAFTDGSKMVVRDRGQSCCEHRYMTCDDDLSKYIGDVLLGMDILDGPYEEGEYGDVHEVQFLHVRTDRGVITAETHNEHNGYYGGFALVLARE